MTFEIIPFCSIGEFKLGLNRQNLNRLASLNYGDEKTSNAIIGSDFILDSSIQIVYQEDIAIYIGALCSHELLFDDLYLSSMSLGKIKQYLSNNNDYYYTDSATAIFINSGLSFFFKEGLEDSACATQISIFQAGYYDELLTTMFQVPTSPHTGLRV